MSEVKITDLVDQSVIDRLKALDDQLKKLVETFTATATDLAKGIDIPVKSLADIERLEKLLAERTKEATEANAKLNDILAQQSQVVANTTNTTARLLMEQERVNKTQRAAYTEHERVKTLLDQFHDTYEGQLQRLIKVDAELKKNTQAQKDNEKALKQGAISADEYARRQTDLVARSRELRQEKSLLNQIMTAEEKANQQADTSYAKMSQQLELLKKAYKGLSAEGRDSDYGKELENTIQNLDAHLKDLAADMGEFQRNVGNYAIAGRNGVVTTESVLSVLAQEAKTMKDVADQTKLLTEAKSMLDIEDVEYEEIVSKINNQLALNSARLNDVTDIMTRQATSVSEAESQNARLSEALKQIDITSADAAERTAELNAKIAENNQIIEENTVKKASLKKDLKEMVLEIATLSIEYQNLSSAEQNSAEGQALKQHIDELIERAGVLKDAIGDTNAAITNAASDTRGFDQAAGAMQLAIDGFGLATGAAEMLGISTGELTEIQTKLQAAMAASNAMQSIQNTLQAQSAVMQGVNLAQTKLRTIAENLHTAAQGKGVIATTALTAAQWAFNAAASANPIGLIVVAIVACIAAVWGLTKAFTAFLGPSDEAIASYAKQKEALDELSEANDRLIERMKARGATEAEMLNQSLLNKQAEKEAADALFAQAQELYDEDEEEYKDALEAKRKADEDYEASKEDGLNYLLGVIHAAEEEEKKQRLGTYEYKRQLIQAELEQQKAIAATLLAQEKITKQVYENLVASLDKAAKMKVEAVNTEEKEATEKKTRSTSRSSGSGTSRADAAKKAAEELKKAVQAGEDALLNIITDSHDRQRAAENLAYDRKLKDLQSQLAKTKATQVALRQAINNQIAGLEADHQRKLESIEASHLERRQRAQAEFINSHLATVEEGSVEELEWRKAQLKNQYDQDLLAFANSEAAKTLTAEEAAEVRSNLLLKYVKDEEKLKADYANKQSALIAQNYANEASQRDAALTLAEAEENKAYLEKVKGAKGNATEIERLKAEHEDNLLKIQEDYARKSADAAIEMLEKQLAVEDLTAEEREQLETALAKAKADKEKLMADQAIEQMNRTADEDAKLKEKRIANAQMWMQAAADALNNVNELAQAIFDGKIQKIEEEQEANTAASEAEQTRISELAEKKVITEEEAEARKRAAQAKSEQKNAELEAKKQKLKEKQAKWDRANAIAQCGIQTALAIMNALQMQPFPVGIAMAAIAGAMGAVQLATILATPIPKYAKGTDYHKGGPAIVGDGGRQEVVVFNNRAWLTPDKPTVVDLPAGASVIPSVEMLTNDIVGGVGVMNPSVQMVTLAGEPNVIVKNNHNTDTRRLEERLDNLANLIKQQTKIQRDIAYDREYEIFKATRI